MVDGSAVPGVFSVYIAGVVIPGLIVALGVRQLIR
ncbi:hypothetical protein BN2475_50085 [Paraburkholderia ribeironis]|uniref:Uncharacterized protein n=1 Tax=Paraburkholderia ribeironis TaxID=1247936 RepID=A0A1N7RKD2_9BURK|nr:hypothetical protein BN2475_50085 [Paraburkholderia ribeironis]